MTKSEFCSMSIGQIKQIPIQELIQMVGNQIDDYPHFSTNNKKLGSRIGSINFLPILSCADNIPCSHNCYARKGRQNANNARWCYFLNWLSYFNDKDKFFSKLKNYILYEELSIIRYFSAGDIPDKDFFVKACELAESLNGIKFLCFTKKGNIVNDYLDQNEKIPNNFSVILSQWGSWQQNNPYDLPTAYVKLKHIECEIPNNAIKCSNYCGDCIRTDHNCWNLKSGESVYFKQH